MAFARRAHPACRAWRGRDRGVSAAVGQRLHPRPVDDGLLFRRLRDGVGPAVRLRRRSEFRPDLSDRHRRLYRGHSRQSLSAADLAVRRRRHARRRHRRRRAGASGAAGARALFRADHAGRRADAAEFHRGRCPSDRRRKRADGARRDLDQRHDQLRDRAVVHGGQRRHPVFAVALAGRAHPAGERPGRGAGRRARLQRHQAQAHGVHHQRVLLRPRRRAAGLLRRLGLGQHAGRHHRRRADHHRRGARRPAHHPRRRARRRSFSSP